MTDHRTPGQAAYEAWCLSAHQDNFPFFDRLQPGDQLRWHAVADAAIRQAKTIIAEEMVRAANEARDV